VSLGPTIRLTHGAADQKPGTRTIGGTAPRVVPETAAIVSDNGSGDSTDSRAVDSLGAQTLRLSRHYSDEGKIEEVESFHIRSRGRQ
jgi:hypothetical protein